MRIFPFLALERFLGPFLRHPVEIKALKFGSQLFFCLFGLQFSFLLPSCISLWMNSTSSGWLGWEETATRVLVGGNAPETTAQSDVKCAQESDVKLCQRAMYIQCAARLCFLMEHRMALPATVPLCNLCWREQERGHWPRNHVCFSLLSTHRLAKPNQPCYLCTLLLGLSYLLCWSDYEFKKLLTI